MLERILRTYRRFNSLSERLVRMQEAQGRIEQRQTSAATLEEAEFRVFSVKTPRDVSRRAQFREFHDEQGQLTFNDFETRLAKIGDLSPHDLRTGQLGKIRDLVRADDGARH